MNDDFSLLTSLNPVPHNSGVLTAQMKKVKFLMEQKCVRVKGDRPDCIYMINRFAEIACIDPKGDITWSKAQ